MEKVRNASVLFGCDDDSRIHDPTKECDLWMFALLSTVCTFRLSEVPFLWDAIARHHGAMQQEMEQQQKRPMSIRMLIDAGMRCGQQLIAITPLCVLLPCVSFVIINYIENNCFFIILYFVLHFLLISSYSFLNSSDLVKS